jgi:hypothetical protein
LTKHSKIIFKILQASIVEEQHQRRWEPQAVKGEGLAWLASPNQKYTISFKTMITSRHSYILWLSHYLSLWRNTVYTSICTCIATYLMFSQEVSPHLPALFSVRACCAHLTPFVHSLCPLYACCRLAAHWCALDRLEN